LPRKRTALLRAVDIPENMFKLLTTTSTIKLS
jgi:hypothetical protein